MKIVTTPMCEEIVKYAGITNYTINKFPQKKDGDLAIILSESTTELKNIKIKINTFKQIKDSIEKISLYGRKQKPSIESIFKKYPIAMKYLNNTPHNLTSLKVYSNFIKDIAEDMGFQIVDKNPDYVIAPDYLKDKVDEDAIIISSHNNITSDPLKKAVMRYSILEEYI